MDTLDRAINFVKQGQDPSVDGQTEAYYRTLLRHWRSMRTPALEHGLRQGVPGFRLQDLFRPLGETIKQRHGQPVGGPPPVWDRESGSIIIPRSLWPMHGIKQPIEGQ